MNVRDCFKIIVEKIKNIYDQQEAKNIADLIIEEIVGLTRQDRLFKEATLVTETQTESIQKIINGLILHQPIQQLLGFAYFWNEKYLVTKDTLIPRPETEQLIDLIQKSKPNNQYYKILDIGTGTGCIPITLSKIYRDANITSVDISAEALSVATQNATLHQASINFQQLDFLHTDSQELLGLYDIIVSNPPYILVAEQEAMHPNVLDYEPHLALFVTDNDPLQFYKKIAHFGLKHLNPEGTIFLELNSVFGKETAAYFEALGYQTELFQDFQDKDRMLKCYLPIS